MFSSFKTNKKFTKKEQNLNCDSKSYTNPNGVYFMSKARFLDPVSSILRSIIADFSPNLKYFNNRALYTYNLP